MTESTLHTNDPIALRYLMTETVFDLGEDVVKTSAQVPTVAVEPEQVKKSEPATLSFDFFGQNKRNYLFLTNEQQAKWMPEAAMDAFVKTLAALGLTADDVALLNLAKLAVAPSAGQLTQFFKPQVVVNLGTPFRWPEKDGVTLFNTHSFGEMLIDADKKRSFWTTIKTLLI